MRETFNVPTVLSTAGPVQYALAVPAGSSGREARGYHWVRATSEDVLLVPRNSREDMLLAPSEPPNLIHAGFRSCLSSVAADNSFEGVSLHARLTCELNKVGRTHTHTRTGAGM